MTCGRAILASAILLAGCEAPAGRDEFSASPIGAYERIGPRGRMTITSAGPPVPDNYRVEFHAPSRGGLAASGEDCFVVAIGKMSNGVIVASSDVDGDQDVVLQRETVGPGGVIIEMGPRASVLVEDRGGARHVCRITFSGAYRRRD